MTELAWMKLRPGDFIMNKRQPGILFKITEAEAGTIRFSSKAGQEHEANKIRYLEFEQWFPTLKMPGF